MNRLYILFSVLSRKFIMIGCLVLMFGYIPSGVQAQAGGSFTPTPRIYNKDPQRVIKTDDIKDPLRDGTYTAIQGSNGAQGSQESVIGVINIGQILSSRDAQSKTIQLIQNIVNYALGFLSFLALIYLLYAGFQMVTAAGDGEKFASGQKALQYTAYAIIGIGVSWIVIRFILIFIDQVVT